MKLRIATAAVVLLALGADARAQVAVGAVVGASHQDEGTSNSPYLGPAFGGTSLSGIGMIDVGVARRVSIGGEISLAGDISGTQSERISGGRNDFVSDHRDTVYSALIKFGTPSDRRVRGRVVGGGGLAQRHTDRTGTTTTEFTPVFVTRPFQETLTDYVWALTGGVDAAFGFNDHVAVLLAVRLHHLNDSDRQPDSVVRRGVSLTIVRYGGGLQVEFGR